MRILLATDGSAGAAQAEEFLRSLPLSSADDVIVVAAGHAGEPDVIDHLSWCRWRLSERDVRARTALRIGHPIQVIESVALEHGCDLVVTGSRGRGAWRGAILGSVARSLAHDGVVPLLVVRSRRAEMRTVLLVIDGSSEARAALELLWRLPLPASASITVVRVEPYDPADRATELSVERVRAMLDGRIASEEVIPSEDVASTVTRMASASDADLVALGIADQTRVTRPLPFSLVDHVLAHAHCAVLVGKAPLAARQIGVPAAAGVVSS